MRHPALAVAQSLWWRSRAGFIAAGVTFAVIAITYPLLFAWTREPAVIVLSVLPFVVLVSVVLRSMLFVEDRGSMSSTYPVSMYVLPVSTPALVFWPMAYASAAAALTWLAIALIVYGPSGFEMSLFLPALALASSMSWLLALSWLPIAAPWLRTAISVGSVLALGTLGWRLYLDSDFPTAAITFLLAGMMVAAFLLGLAAVSSARRGEVWCARPELCFSAAVNRPHSRRREQRPFTSPAAAQFWYEWKCHGMNLPCVVSLIMVLITLMKLHAGSRNNEFVLPIILTSFLMMPIVQSASIGTGVGRFKPMWVRSRGFNTFVAIRPMTSGDVVAAKFRMLLASVLLTWVIVLAGTALWIVATGNTQNLSWMVRSYRAQHPAREAVALLIAAIVLLPAWTWKHAGDGLAPSITGRRWMEGIFAFLTIGTILTLIAGALRFVIHPEELKWFLGIVPALVISAAVIKSVVAIVSYSLALKRGLIDWPFLLRAVAGTLVSVLFAIALLQLSLPSGVVPIPRPILLLGIVTLIPLGRFPLATLAMEWNRHR
jgi:hypothetical protein